MRRGKVAFFVALLVLSSVAMAAAPIAQRSSWTGGGGSLSSPGFKLKAALGQAMSSRASSAGYIIRDGLIAPPSHSPDVIAPSPSPTISPQPSVPQEETILIPLVLS